MRTNNQAIGLINKTPLAFAGFNEENEPEFIGTDKQWKEHENLQDLLEEIEGRKFITF